MMTSHSHENIRKWNYWEVHTSKNMFIINAKHRFRNRAGSNRDKRKTENHWCKSLATGYSKRSLSMQLGCWARGRGPNRLTWVCLILLDSRHLWRDPLSNQDTHKLIVDWAFQAKPCKLNVGQNLQCICRTSWQFSVAYGLQAIGSQVLSGGPRGVLGLNFKCLSFKWWVGNMSIQLGNLVSMEHDKKHEQN